MAIKNSLLVAGTDNVNGDIIDADNVNDTNNAIINGSGNYNAGFTELLDGLDVTEQGTPGLTVDITAGTVQINGINYAISSGTATFTNADGSNPRWDIISVDNTGSFTVTAGTAAATPVMPAIPSNECVFACVYRATSDNTINDEEITKFWNNQSNIGEKLIYEYDATSTSMPSVNVPMPNGTTYKTLRIVISDCETNPISGTSIIGLVVNNFTSTSSYRLLRRTGAGVYSVVNTEEFPLYAFNSTTKTTITADVLLSMGVSSATNCAHTSPVVSSTLVQSTAYYLVSGNVAGLSTSYFTGIKFKYANIASTLKYKIYLVE